MCLVLEQNIFVLWLLFQQCVSGARRVLGLTHETCNITEINWTVWNMDEEGGGERRIALLLSANI